MSKYQITLEVDDVMLFDMLHKMQGDTKALGSRLAGLLLTGEIGTIDAIGMAVYGVTHVETTPAITAQPEESQR
jgi:hypothetical protein